MCRVIIDEDLFDRDFVSRYCEGFDGFRDHLREQGYTPGMGRTNHRHRRWANSTHRARVRNHGSRAMSAIYKGSGYYTNGADAGRACYILDAICGRGRQAGQSGAQGLGPASARRSRSPMTQRPHRRRIRFTSRWATRLRRICPTRACPDAVIDGNPYPVKGLFVQASNPVMSDPNRDRVQKMFAHLELAVTCDLFMSETALESDVVLPETSFHEQAGNSPGHVEGPEVVLCQPVVDRVGEAKPA